MKPAAKTVILILGAGIITAIFVAPRTNEPHRVKQQEPAPLPKGWYEVDSRDFDFDHNGILSTVEQDKMWAELSNRYKDLEGLALRSSKK